MVPHGAAEPSEVQAQRDATRWGLLDQAMRWLMVGWAFLSFFALPLDEAFHVDNGAPLTALLAAVVVVWSTLAVTASVLALRHARASRGQPFLAWSAVPAVLALALPLAVAFLGEHDYTEDEDAVCSPGLVPAAVPEALFGWIPWPAYAWVPAVTASIGLGCLALRETRRPGAWILAGTLLGLSLFASGFALITNHCD